MKYGLSDVVLGQIREVLAGFPAVVAVILYGSRAKGSYRPGSDVDLVLRGDGLDASTVARVEMELDDLLLPCRFDLSAFSSIQQPELLDHIRRVGKVLYRRVPQEGAVGSG